VTSPPRTTTIMLADDDREFTSAIAVRLEHVGYTTMVAHDAYTALSLAVHHAPDLIILDIGMPAGGGFSVLERLRNGDVPTRPPVIMISGDNSADSRATAHAFGAYAFMSKPIESGDLIRTVQSALRGTDKTHSEHGMETARC